MKIGFLSRWGATCGVGMHAEILAREFIRMGHEVVVFAPTEESASKEVKYYKRTEAQDPEFVKREIYTEVDNVTEEGWVKEEEILKENLDLLIIETFWRVPVKPLTRLIEKLKIPVISVFHEANIFKAREVVKLPCDKIVVFDRRFYDEILEFYEIPREKVEVISYPVMKSYDVEPERPVSEDKFLFFSFGRQPVEEYCDFLNALKKLRKRFDNVHYWIIRSDGRVDYEAEWITQWQKRPTVEKLYSYLKGSNVHLLPKGNTPNVVVSSTLYQIIASETPIVIRDSRFVETIETDAYGFGPIVKYRNIHDLVHKLELLMLDREQVEDIKKEVRVFVEKYGGDKIAQEFLDLAKTITK